MTRAVYEATATAETTAQVCEAVLRGTSEYRKGENTMTFILWLIAVVLVIWGIITLVRGGVLMGIVLIILGLIIGPGGYSIFK
jgi:hypothetical protein